MLGWLARVLEVLILIALLTVTRCTNYQDVFLPGQVAFIDPDCYARMTRAKLCFQHPGTVVRHHDFENFPTGTSPHTTALLDYCIVGMAAVIVPVTRNPLDLAGALVSPVISIALGIFLWWWMRRTELQFRWAALLLYIGSPILAHGFAIGRPDHQSLAIALVTVALCAEWTLAHAYSRSFVIVSGAAWALAIWVSPYEPLVLFAFLLILLNQRILASNRRVGWVVFGAIIIAALLIERRIPLPPTGNISALKNWSGTVGELAHMPITDAVWFQWCGWLLVLTPILFWNLRRNTAWFLSILLLATFFLTVWQARWGYFFVLLFVLLVPQILSTIRRPWIAWLLLAIGLFPVLQAWDRTLSSQELAQRWENRIDQIELHALAGRIDGPFIAPWWFSPALSYWSGQPGVAGSSHEAISGTTDSAKFFGTDNADEARVICDQHKVKWVVAYDSDRVAKNSGAILGLSISSRALVYILDRNASNAPAFLHLNAQTGRFKLFQNEDL